MGKGKVLLVGAGPGDPGLITVKGMQAIQQADVILYDGLANPALLVHAPDGCERINVEKKPGFQRVQQDEINQLMVDRATSGCCVVRLKGGDPIVFGRGGEEAEVLKRAGIEFEIVPGISSAFAAPIPDRSPGHRTFLGRSILEGVTPERGAASGCPAIRENLSPKRPFFRLHHIRPAHRSGQISPHR